MGIAVRTLVRKRPPQGVILTKSSQDYYLKFLADNCSVTVISIGYRLAPESPFPAGPNDCYDAAEYLIEHGKADFGGSLKFIGGEVSWSKFQGLSTLSTSFLKIHTYSRLYGRVSSPSTWPRHRDINLKVMENPISTH